MAMNNRWYWAFKHILFGPALQLWNRPWIEGVENIPASGPAIVASSHQSVMDSFYFPLKCPRQIKFIAKAEYFNTPGFVGRMQKWFFSSVGQVPIDRTAKSSSEGMLNSAREILNDGGLFGIYPEGTRSPDGRIYRGRTGMARVAMDTGVQVIPIAMFNSRKANPIGTWIPRPVRVGTRVGQPIDPRAWAKEQGLDVEDHETARKFTDYFMLELAQLAEQPYVDVYASEVKDSLKKGLGYPKGAEPTK